MKAKINWHTVKLGSSKRAVAIARCSQCGQTYWERSRSDGLGRYQDCQHETWCEFGAVNGAPGHAG